LKVDDSGHPPHSATKDFHATVDTALLLDWLDAPKVRDNRIDGSVPVSNGSHDTYDLTVVIVAVASADQRATAIGYERFDLKPGANNIRISFGQTLPAGGYVVHADAIAEVPERSEGCAVLLEVAKVLERNSRRVQLGASSSKLVATNKSPEVMLNSFLSASSSRLDPC